MKTRTSQPYQPSNKKVRVVGAVGVLLGPIVALAAVAEPLRAQTSPRPAVCPPSTSQAAPAGGPATQQPPATPTTRQAPARLQMPPYTSQRANPNVAQPPLPSQRQDPIAMVTPTGRTVAVQLINRTGTTVNYEAIAATDYLPLKTGATTTLRGLNLPSTITLERQDAGFLRLSTQSQPGLLKVYLYPSNNFDDDAGALRIQESGVVYLN